MAANRSGRALRRGLTLLEVILVLGLGTLILYAVSMAIDFHLRTLDVRRANVEEAQIARAVLNMIANDLRSTVREYRMDTSGIEQMLAGLAGGGGSGSGSGGSGGPPGDGGGNGQNNGGQGGGSGNNNSGNSGNQNGPGNGNQNQNQNGGSGTGNQNGGGGNTGSGSTGGTSTGGSDDSGGTENTDDLASATALPPTPGLYGNQFQLQLDVSRLPRPDQYIPLTANQASLPQIPSDVKTVTYFVQNELTLGSNVKDPFDFGNSPGDAPAVGLVRREVDRAVVQFAQTNGTSEALLRTGDLIAREVTAIQFQYFDGTQWLPEWDSAAKKGLPVAIEILVEVTPLNKIVPRSAVPAAATAVAEPVLYRLVVQMPLGEPADLESENMAEGMENLGL